MNQPSLNEYQMRPRYKFSNERTAAELRSSLKQALSSDANWPLQYKDTHGHLIFSYKKKRLFYVRRPRIILRKFGKLRRGLVEVG